MEQITHDRLRISSKYPIKSLMELSLIRKFNEHGKLKIKGILEEVDIHELIREDTRNEPLDIFVTPQDEEEILFSGIITQHKIIHESRFYTIELEVESETKIFDREKKTQTYQNKDMTYSELLKELLETDYPNYDFRNPTSNPKIGTMKLRYQETAWEFAKDWQVNSIPS